MRLKERRKDSKEKHKSRKSLSCEQKLDAIVCIVDLVKKDSEIKLLIGCTPAEKAYIKSFYNEWPQMGGILIERK